MLFLVSQRKYQHNLCQSHGNANYTEWTCLSYHKEGIHIRYVPVVLQRWTAYNLCISKYTILNKDIINFMFLRNFGSSLPPVVWRRDNVLFMVFVCVCLRMVVSNAYCVVFFVLLFLCLVCPVLLVSLDCPFLTAPSVFSNVYLVFCRCFNAGTFDINRQQMQPPDKLPNMNHHQGFRIVIPPYPARRHHYLRPGDGLGNSVRRVWRYQRGNHIP